jgi:protein-L-isoaspartate O-methyltransferase
VRLDVAALGSVIRERFKPARLSDMAYRTADFFFSKGTVGR